MKKFLTMVCDFFTPKGIRLIDEPLYNRGGKFYYRWELDVTGKPIDHSKHFVLSG